MTTTDEFDTPLTRTEAIVFVIMLYLIVAWRSIGLSPFASRERRFIRQHFGPVVIGLILAIAAFTLAVGVSDICGREIGSFGCTAAWNFDGQLAAAVKPWLLKIFGH